MTTVSEDRSEDGGRQPTIACLACGSQHLSHWADATDAEYRSIADTFGYWRCCDCAALSISPVPRDRLAEIYPPSYYSFGGPAQGFAGRIKRALDRRLLRKLTAAYLGKDLSALDVGGGTGWMLNELRAVDPRFTRTVVVDLDPSARRVAEDRGHEFVIGRIEDAVFDKPFDLILMLNLLEHVAKPTEVLARMGRALSPNGKLLLKTPNYDSFDARLFRNADWGGYHCPRHWTLFTPESLRAAIARAGLCAESIRCTQGAPFWTWSVLALMARCGVIRVTRDRPMYRHALASPLMAIFGAIDFLRMPFARTSQMVAVLSRE